VHEVVLVSLVAGAEVAVAAAEAVVVVGADSHTQVVVGKVEVVAEVLGLELSVECRL
jgi:hypothetical protein